VLTFETAKGKFKQSLQKTLNEFYGKLRWEED